MSEVPLPDLELGGGEEVERLRDGSLGAVQGLGVRRSGFGFTYTHQVRPRCCPGSGLQLLRGLGLSLRVHVLGFSLPE